MELFQQLLWDLGEIMQLPLHADHNHSCRILLDEKMEIQLEMEQSGEKLLIAAYLPDLPPGRFREDMLKQALKANGRYQRAGSFAYSEKNNILVLQQFLFPSQLTGEKLATFLTEFVTYAHAWRTSILSGTPPSLASFESNLPPPPPFGLR